MTKLQELWLRHPKIVYDRQYYFEGTRLLRVGVATEAIASRFRSGEEIAHLAKDYGTSPRMIAAAIRFELDVLKHRISRRKLKESP